jgi:hypothetical protein
MTTNKLKSLLKVASEIINLYLSQVDLNPTDPSFTIYPYYDKDEKTSESVNIHFANWDFNHEFLEPLAAKLSKTNIQWSMIREEKEFEISLYF